MKRNNLILIFAFALLASFKFISIILEKQAFGSAAILPALMFMFMFGSPQIVWLFKCAKTELTEKQLNLAIVVAALFAGTALNFGYFPGISRPSFGGEYHLEVPAAFIVEWLIAGISLVIFSKLTNKK
jgi:hypothetical protein